MISARTCFIASLTPLLLAHFAPCMTATDSPSGILIDTFAGGKIRSGVLAQNVLLPDLTSLAWDPAGNVVICDIDNDVIRRIRPDGIIETIAGAGVTGFAGDGGLALDAIFDQPMLPRYDSAGNLYFFDSGNFRIRRIDRQGNIASVAGNGLQHQIGQNLSGPADAVSLDRIIDMAIDHRGNIYLLENALNIIRRITPAGNLEIFAGGASPSCDTCISNGGLLATEAQLYSPASLAIGGDGSVYVVESALNPDTMAPRIRRISSDGIITTFLNGTHVGGAIYSLPQSLTSDPAGNLYGVSGASIVRLNADATTTLLAGTASSTASGPSSPDGPALPSVINSRGIAVDAQGNIAFIDKGTANMEIREITGQSQLKTLAGQNPKPAPDGTPLRDAWFIGLSSIAFDHNGNLYIAESVPCLIRKIDTKGVLSTFAGNGNCAYPKPAGNAVDALAPVGSLAVDSQNRLWVADLDLNLYSIDQNGPITFYAKPTPVTGTTGKIAIDSKDRVYVMGSLSLYRILADGATRQTVVAPPESGNASLLNGAGLGVDTAGNMYFGTYDSVYRVNDDATYSQLYSRGVGGSFVVNAAGSVWSAPCIIDGSGERCLGLGPGFAGDGSIAQQARILSSQSVFAPNGDLYFVSGDRIRKLTGLSAPVPTPAIGSRGVVNAFSLTGGSLAPLEVVSIFATNFPVSGTQSNPITNNSYSKALGRIKVLINGVVEAPILAATPTQINTILPANTNPDTLVTVAVQVDSAVSESVTAPSTSAAPGLATADASGSGQGAILNQDYTTNSSQNPAARGSVIALYGTGMGLTSPALWDGALVLSTPYPAPQNKVAVTIGGQPAEVTYAGAAPYLPSGVFQINARVPAGIPAGNASVVVSIGGIPTTRTVTVAVR
jgi:uncharacterized protein (TIGR03437 family)